MIRPFASLLASVLALGAAIDPAQAAEKDYVPARIELHAFQSIWISDQQFLTGDDKGKVVTLAGALRFPPVPGKLPVVVLVHGSGGISGNIPMWEQDLGALGIATFTIDSMSGRGLQGVGTNQATLGRANMILDVYRGLEVLAKNARIDPQRVAIMGFSRGGQATLYSSLTRFQKMWNKSGITPAAYIPLYPDCSTTYQGDTEMTNAPIRIFHGAPDSYNPIASCKAYMGRLKAAGRDIDISEFPNAPHGYDNPLGAVPAAVAKDNQSVRNCKLREGDGGVLMNVATEQPFAYSDACVALDPVVGDDPDARDASRKAVGVFLKTLFQGN
jgi:dienelactone hydrolase